MIVMLCRNRVADFSKCKSVFDAHTAAHRGAGLILKILCRSLEDPNNVFFLFEVTDVAKVREVISNPAASEVGKESFVNYFVIIFNANKIVNKFI